MKVIYKFIKANTKIGDYLILMCLLLASFIPIIIFQLNQNSEKNNNDLYAIVSIDGKEVDRFNLAEIDDYEKTYYPASNQYNIVQINHGRIRVKADNSPDQIAVKTGWISKSGQTSICLPHRLVIEVSRANEADEAGSLIY
ncbi:MULTISPECIES: NusG domain II-containing protein [unclassified Enterococcus]|uniref:NusG domain II-containing protein n=1 Tax=unclassified Enterococcus TaxID=2608891 RepID=UPI00201B3B15|nr:MULTISPECIES: NusG domain II-containing protein [unclassified Enterococcus]